MMGNESSNGAEEPTVWVYHSAVVSDEISRMLANWLKGPFQIQKCPQFRTEAAGSRLAAPLTRPLSSALSCVRHATKR